MKKRKESNGHLCSPMILHPSSLLTLLLGTLAGQMEWSERLER